MLSDPLLPSLPQTSYFWLPFSSVHRPPRPTACYCYCLPHNPHFSSPGLLMFLAHPFHSYFQHSLELGLGLTIWIVTPRGTSGTLGCRSALPVSPSRLAKGILEGLTTWSPDLPAMDRMCVARAIQRIEPAGCPYPAERLACLGVEAALGFQGCVVLEADMSSSNCWHYLGSKNSLS